MARKKAETVEEEIKVEEVVETTPEVVEEKPKRGRKKKVEEPEVEVSTAEVDLTKEIHVETADAIVDLDSTPAPVVVNTPVVIEEPKVEEPKTETPVVASTSYTAIAKTSLYVLKTPGVLNSRVGNYKLGTKFVILEEDKGWGKIAENRWVNLNYIEKA